MDLWDSLNDMSENFWSLTDADPSLQGDRHAVVLELFRRAKKWLEIYNECHDLMSVKPIAVYGIFEDLTPYQHIMCVYTAFNFISRLCLFTFVLLYNSDFIAFLGFLTFLL